MREQLRVVLCVTIYLSVGYDCRIRRRLVNIRGNSYRLRCHMELSKAIHPKASRAISAEHTGNGRVGS